MGTSCWEPLLGNLLLGTLAWEPLPGNPCLGTSSWEPLLGNLFLGTLLGTSWEPCLGTCCWEPLLGNLFLTLLRNLSLGILLWEHCGNLFLGNSSWETLPGNLAWWNLLGTLLGGTLLGGTSWEPCPGNLETIAWDCLGKGDRFLGTWFPDSQPCATLASLATFTWEPWGTELFGSAPKPLLWLKTPKLLLLGKKQVKSKKRKQGKRWNCSVLDLTHIPDSHLA